MCMKTKASEFLVPMPLFSYIKFPLFGNNLLICGNIGYLVPIYSGILKP